MNYGRGAKNTTTLEVPDFLREYPFSLEKLSGGASHCQIS